MSRYIERVYPYVLAAVGLAIFWRFHISLPTSGQEILSASITLGSIFTGFLATAQSIIVSFQSPRFETFRQTKFYPLLLGYLQEAIWASLTYCGFTMIGYFQDAAIRPTWYPLGWVFFTTLSVASFFRVTTLLSSLIRHL